MHRCYGNRFLPVEVTVNIDEEAPWENFRLDDATCESDCIMPIWSSGSSDGGMLLQGVGSTGAVPSSGLINDVGESLRGAELAIGESSNVSTIQSHNSVPSLNVTVPLEPEHNQSAPESQQDNQEPLSRDRCAI